MIRIADIDDHSSVAKLMIDGAVEKGADFASDKISQTVKEFIDRDRVVVCELGGDVCAALLWSEPECHLSGKPLFYKVALYVEKKRRGSNCARLLMDFAIQRAKHIKACRIVFSGIIDSNYEKVESLFLKYGMSPTEVTFEKVT